MSNPTGRVRMTLVAACALAWSVAPASADDVCPKRGGTVKAVDMTYAAMDPTAKRDPDSYVAMIYDSLIDVMPDLTYRPGLAAALPDKVGDRGYVFKLRPNIKFHDGTDFTADAVKYNLDRIVTGEAITPYTGLWREWLDKVTVVDRDTVRIDLKRPWQDFYWAVASTLYIASPTMLKAQGKAYGTQTAAGTGPFMMKSFAPRDRIELVRNPTYYRTGEPCLDGIVGTYIASGSVRLLSLKKGDLTNVYTFPESLLPLVEHDPNIVVKEAAATTLTVLAVNTKVPALQDLRVRQAIQYALDGKEIVDKVYRGRGAAVESLFPPWHPAFAKAADLTPIRPDAAKAKALLTAAGYDPDKPLKLVLEAFNAPAHVERSVLIQAQLKAVGIDLEVRNLPASQAVQNLQSGNYELSLDQIDGGPTVADYTWDLFAGASGQNYTGFNQPGGYQDPAAEALLAKIAAAPDAKAAGGDIAAFQRLAFSDLPYIYVDFRNSRDAYRREERNFVGSKLKNRQDYRTVWLDK